MGSIVFHPDYASNSRLFVITGEQLNAGTPHYSPGHGNMTAGAFDNVIYEYQVDPSNSNRVDPNSKRELLRLQIPGGIHNIDDLTFGNDGHLYVSIGDSGPTDAPGATYYLNGQDTTTPFGSVLRLDVDSDPNGPGGNGRYVIPSDNPFADGAGGNVPEIFAWGFRNPWRISTDPVTGKIFTGDNGERSREEVNLVELGNNYGWAIKEGTYLYNPITRNISPDPNPDPAYTDPFAEYGRLDGRSIIGGYVYRGSLMPQFYGDYFFADYVMRKLFVMNIDTGELEVIPIDLDGAAFNSNAITFGEDEWGELYLGFENGRVYRLVPEPTSLALLVLGGVTLFGRRRHPHTA